MTLTYAGNDQERGDAAPDVAALVSEVERLLAAGIGITAIAIDQTPDAEELTLAQWRALVVTAGNDGLRIGELAGRLGLSGPSASRLIRRLEGRGLVSAVRAQDDRRATNVSLTPTGRGIVEAVVGRRRRLIRLALEQDQARTSDHSVGLLHDLAGLLADFA